MYVLETSTQNILSVLDTVPDPEVPVLSVIDLGIVRDVKHDGDTVEIITKKLGMPNRKWLEFVKTSGARKHIRAALQKKKL